MLVTSSYEKNARHDNKTETKEDEEEMKIRRTQKLGLNCTK
jgi:hypothetical protein